MSFRFKTGLIAASVLAAGLIGALPALASTPIRLPFKVSAQNIRGKLMQDFANQVEKATDGHYKVILYPGGQLYGGTSAAQAVQLGNVEMATPPDSAFTGYTKAVSLLEVPFAFRSPRDYFEFMDGPSGQAILAQLKKDGLVGLAMFGEGPFVIGSKSRLLKSPKDFKGQMIRTSGHKVVIDALHAMGASTVKIDFQEVYSALQQGTISAVYTTLDAYVSDKMYEVAPHVILFPSHGAYIWVVNKTWWDKQPAKYQTVIRGIARKLADKYDQEVWADLKSNVAVLEKHGANYFDPTADESTLKEFRAAIKPVYANLKKSYGADVIDALLAGKTISSSALATTH